MDPKTSLPPQETYTLPDNPTAVPKFVNEYTRKGYVVVVMTATHITLQPPAKPSEGATTEKQKLLD